MTANSGVQLIADQIFGLFRQINDSIYTRPMRAFHGGTVGQHMRHILEFYVCLLEGLEPGQIDYGARKRNHILSDRVEAAAAALDFICNSSVGLDENQKLRVKGEYGQDSDGPVFESSAGREFQYAFDHAVHHLAIIRIGLEVHCPEVICDPELGIAPSTLKHRKSLHKPAEQVVLTETHYG